MSSFNTLFDYCKARKDHVHANFKILKQDGCYNILIYEIENNDVKKLAYLICTKVNNDPMGLDPYRLKIKTTPLLIKETVSKHGCFYTSNDYRYGWITYRGAESGHLGTFIKIHFSYDFNELILIKDGNEVIIRDLIYYQTRDEELLSQVEELTKGFNILLEEIQTIKDFLFAKKNFEDLKANELEPKKLDSTQVQLKV